MEKFTEINIFKVKKYGIFHIFSMKIILNYAHSPFDLIDDKGC